MIENKEEKIKKAREFFRLLESDKKDNPEEIAKRAFFIQEKLSKLN